MEKILLAGAIIDFYIDKDKYKKLKTKTGKYSYVEKVLKSIFNKIIGINVNNIEIRDVSITSNNFWGQEKLLEINDIGYSCNNILDKNEDFTTLRIFQIDIVGVVSNDFNICDSFIEIKDNDYLLTISSARLC